MPLLQSIVAKAYYPLLAVGIFYFTCLGLLTHPVIQNNAIYMQKLKLTWRQDLTRPEQFGFAKNQVTPFYLNTTDGESIFAWHVLPLGLYMEHRDELAELETGIETNPAEHRSLQLLKDDPEARLIIHFHGNAGTLGAGIRPIYLRSLSSAHPSKIHILAIDYRGFGLSSGVPSEAGLIEDGLTAFRFASSLGIPSSRIALVGQSLGTAVTIGVADSLASQTPKQELAAVITIAGFSNMKELLQTYHIGGFIPILSPLRGYPKVRGFFESFIYESWNTTARIGSLVKNSPSLSLVLIHAKNDFEIPWQHCEKLFAYATNAAVLQGGEHAEPLTLGEALEIRKVKNYGYESTHAWWPEERSYGRTISQWLVKWGGHNQVVMSAGTSVIVSKALGL
ncbi:Similar to Monoacylglycerol lipase ABHD12; acc. no. Q08C93 [Pyronema omphalodes CBS 100304]|uniref:Similar to Monoacylglycerol lipase ABHD12 acc. no. Q08C93 n=1 Tax=Pyronema omphalodes (strain CBS 100304) TaxID=1076935 RepID=U4LDF9_PYROM|nr:Similar to Monoacylglycerol lipase ABHD12; acc. no. Q08C93 [Pyronema omphalodes CBS 100304]